MSPEKTKSGFRRFARPHMPEHLPVRRLIWIVAGAALAYLLVLSDFGLLRRWRLAREAAALEAHLVELEQRREELQVRRSEIHDDDALERIAREEYGMVRSGEHVYRLAVPDTAGGER